MVSPRSNIEALLGIKAPGPTPDPTVPSGIGASGLSVEGARLLTGASSPAMPPGMEETQVGAPPSPMSDPVPPQNPPTAGNPSAPGGVPGAGTAPATPDYSANAPENGDLVKDFWSRHGRAPTTTDIRMMHAIPLIERQLGRAPMRIEVLQMLGARRETPESGTLQFEPEIPAGANPVSVTMGMAPGQEPLPPPPAPAPQAQY